MGFYSSVPNADAVAGMVIAMLLTWLLSGVFSIVVYVLESLGIYTVAKRRGIRNPWLAWIPVANVWIWGSLSDQYQYVVKNKMTNRRWILVVLSGLTVLFSLVMGGFYVNLIVKIVTNMDTLKYMSEARAMQMVLQPMLGMLGTVMLMAVVAIVNTVFTYIALYDIFASMEPSNAALYLVLSILIGVTLPFFIFCNRKKDGGMPPRRSEPVLDPPTTF